MSTYLNLMMGAKSESKREDNDFYATHPTATRSFLDKIISDNIRLSPNIWECACGEGHISKVLKEYGYNVRSSDLIDRGYGEVKNFLDTTYLENDFDILTNPPYKIAEDFVEKAMSLLGKGRKLILFLKIQFLESKKRLELFKKFPPKYVYIHSERQLTSKDGSFETLNAKSIAYIWIIREKGFNGETVLRWI